MNTNISQIINFNKPYIIVDFEANGDLHNPYLLQVGAIKIVNHQIVERFNQWCYYDGEISRFISLLLNKQPSFYLQQPKEEVVWQQFLDFCAGVDQIFNFGKHYDSLIIEKVHERTGLDIIALIDLQDAYFNPMCGIDKPNQAVVSLDVVNRVFDCPEDDFGHLEHNAYEDCLLLFQTIEHCYQQEQVSQVQLCDMFYQAYLMPRPKNFRGISKKTKTLDLIKLQPKSPFLFIFHWVEPLGNYQINYHNDVYLIDQQQVQLLKQFSLKSDVDNQHDFYANFKEVESYIYTSLGLDQYIFVSNVDFLIKKLQTTYASRYKSYPLIYWVPFEWIKVRLNLDTNDLDANQKQQVFDLLQSIYCHYWKVN